MNVMVKKEWIEKGYVDEPVDEALDLKAEIRKLCKEKDAIILAHYYTVRFRTSPTLLATLWLWLVKLQKPMPRLWLCVACTSWLRHANS